MSDGKCIVSTPSINVQGVLGFTFLMPPYHRGRRLLSERPDRTKKAASREFPCQQNYKVGNGFDSLMLQCMPGSMYITFGEGNFLCMCSREARGHRAFHVPRTASVQLESVMKKQATRKEGTEQMWSSYY